MSDLITVSLGLASFHVTSQPHFETNRQGNKVTVTDGEIEGGLPERCHLCGGPMDRHDSHTTVIQTIPIMLRVHLLRVTVRRKRCRDCGHVESQEIPFKAEGHRITDLLRRVLEHELSDGCTVKALAWRYMVHPSIVKAIDKERLRRAYEGRRPGPCMYLGVDEFLLHRGHRYATEFINLQTGEVLWCCEGKDKSAVDRFIAYVGEKWMRKVQVVAMDMNAQYDSAFRENPASAHVRIGYDFFHLVKLGNDSMISRLRKRMQRELRDSGDEQGYRLLKSCRFVVLSSRETILRKDLAAHQWNKRLSGLVFAGALPKNTRMAREDRGLRLEKLLRKNNGLYTCYVLVEQLKAAFKSDGPRNADAVRARFRDWLRLARQSGIEEALAFADTVERHLEGIINAIRYGVSTGILEGTNNMIKTIRRQACGFRDTRYFFSKIYENSRRPYRFRVSHKILL